MSRTEGKQAVDGKLLMHVKHLTHKNAEHCVAAARHEPHNINPHVEGLPPGSRWQALGIS